MRRVEIHGKKNLMDTTATRSVDGTGRPYNAIRDAFDENQAPGSRSITKHDNYFAVYDRCLAPYRHRPIKLLEIGVQHGGSMQMWKRYLHPDSLVVGIDIYPDCKKFEEENIQIFIGDQSDKDFLKSVVAASGPFDVIIDDGSHIPWHQIASFEYLFLEGLSIGGLYLVEDCHTSYWPRYGGGEKRGNTFIEYAKSTVDDLNYWHIEKPSRDKGWLTDILVSVEFHSSIVVFRKEAVQPPKSIVVGDVKSLDLEAPFSGGRLGRLVVTAKRSDFLQGIVRRYPAMWRLMKRLMR